MFEFFERTNPTLLVGGAVLALFTSPKVRKAARRTLVKSMAAVMTLANEASQLGTKAREEMKSMVEESKEQSRMRPMEDAT